MQKFKILLLPIVLMIITVSSCAAQKITLSKKNVEDAVDTFKAEKNKKGDALPELNLLSWQDEVYTDKRIPKDWAVMLVIFNPGCGHCKEIITKVIGNMGMFEKTAITFVAGQPLHGELPRFVGEMRADKVPNLLIASDQGDLITKKFEYNGIPQIMLYNKKRRLQHIYYSEASLLDMQRHLNAK